MRWWNDTAASVDDAIGLGLVLLGLLLLAGLVAAAWYWFPAWVPRRLPNLRAAGRASRRFLAFLGRVPGRLAGLLSILATRMRAWRWRAPGWQWRAVWRWLLWWRRRRRPAKTDEPAMEEPVDSSDELPDQPAEAFLALADRLAAAGRYAEAVRERLRAMVRDLVERGVIGHQPGWTVTELANAAGVARPVVAPPLGQAATVFSDIWYGQRPASVNDDERMRVLATEVARGAAAPVLPVVMGALPVTRPTTPAGAAPA